MSESSPAPPPGRRRRPVLIPVIISVLITVPAMAAIFALAVVITGQPGGAPAPTVHVPLASAPAIDIFRTNFDQLVSGRTEALKAGDEKAFLEPFTGRARDTERKIFRNLAKIHFVVASYRMIAADPPDTLITKVTVAFVHQIKGVDLRPVAEQYTWTVKRGPDGDAITGVAGADGSNQAFYPMPWDVYPDMTVVSRRHVLVISAQGDRALAKKSAGVLARAADDDLAVWKRSGPPGTVTTPGFLISLASERKIFSRLYLDTQKDDRNEVGFDIGLPAVDSHDRLLMGGSRIALDTTEWNRYLEGDVLMIGRHEIAHAMVDALATVDGEIGFRTWVVEGFAHYMELRGNPAQQRAELDFLRYKHARADRLPANRDFYAKDLATRQANYAFAELAMRFISQRWGEKALMAFVAAQYTVPAEIDRQLTLITGHGLARFERDWRAYVKSRLRG